MPINFPGSLDTLPKPTNGQAMNQAGALAGDVVSDMALAIEALQAKVGANSSAVTTSLDYFRASVRGSGGVPAGAGVFSSLSLSTALAVASGGTGATTASGARSNLGLGTMATQAASSYGALADANMWSAVQTISGGGAAPSFASHYMLRLIGFGADCSAALVAGATSSSRLLFGTPTSLAQGGFVYENGTDTLNIRAANGNRAVVTAAGLSVAGSTTTSTHFAVGSTQVLGARRTGWAAATGTATRSSFATSTVTVAQLAERVKALTDDLISHGIIGA